MDADKPDWFEYKQIDSNSTKMNIKDDIILIEFRAFPRMLANYISSVLGASDRDEMNKKVLGLLSIGTLEKFIRKYNSERNLKFDTLTLASLMGNGEESKDTPKEASKEAPKKDSSNKLPTNKKTSVTKNRKYKSATTTRKFNKKNLQKQFMQFQSQKN
jgi:hypothetical protein